jgi:hypothetical protein
MCTRKECALQRLSQCAPWSMAFENEIWEQTRKRTACLKLPFSSLLVPAVSDKGQAFFGNPQGESVLWRLAELAEEFDAEQVATDARSAAERVSEGRSYVACIGQFKRGKSSVQMRSWATVYYPPESCRLLPFRQLFATGFLLRPACALRQARGQRFRLRPSMSMSLKKKPKTRVRYLLPHRLWLIRRK